VREVVPDVAEVVERVFGRVLGWNLEDETPSRPRVVRRWPEDITPITRRDRAVRPLLVVVHEDGAASTEETFAPCPAPPVASRSPHASSRRQVTRRPR
jgi:hypothetical protein